jgi:hypothetical protein
VIKPWKKDIGRIVIDAETGRVVGNLQGFTGQTCKVLFFSTNQVENVSRDSLIWDRRFPRQRSAFVTRLGRWFGRRKD